jgi:hypothetical protein
MRMKRLSLALLLVAAGCTPMQWARPDATPEQIEADSQYCQQVAWNEARLSYMGTFGAYGGSMYRDPLGRRFVASPFTPLDPLGDRDMEEQRLANFCMRSRGYELVPAPKN